MSKNERHSNYAACLSLMLYAAATYVAALWWLTPLFFACVAATFFKPCEHPRFLSLYGWCFCAALITLFPCLWMGAHCTQSVWSALCINSCMLLVGTSIFVGASLVIWWVKKNVRTRFVHLCAFVGAQVGVWWFIDTTFFWWVAPGYGYMLANPVLPLCADARLLALAPYLGTYGLLGLMLFGAGGAVQWWYQNLKSSRGIALGVAAVVVAGSFLAPRAQRPPCIVGRIVALGGEGLEGKCFLETLSVLKERCALCQDYDLMVGPESLVPYPLNQAASACVMLDDGAVTWPVILFGAPCQTRQGRYNSAYCVHEGRITYCYDKITLLPLFEKPLSDCRFLPGLQGLFNPRGKSGYLPGCAKLAAGKPAAGETTLVVGGVRYRIRICLCSDLFCGTVTPPTEPDSRAPGPLGPGLVIALVNDEWFFGSCMADRMLWFAALWAARHRTPVVYVGYRRAAFIEKSGRQWPLARVGKNGLFLA